MNLDRLAAARLVRAAVECALLAGVRQVIETVGARLLYLPPYSPDFNPIEQLFAKLKALLREAAERSIDGLWSRIATLLDAFTPEECANYLRNAGYASC
jgi:transposase